MSKKNLSKNDVRPSGKGIEFGNTQLNSAEYDIKVARDALKQAMTRVQYSLKRAEGRKADIEEMLTDDKKRQYNPTNPRSFRPAVWVNAGLLRTKFHTEKYWKNESAKVQRKIDGLLKTIEKMGLGRLRFHPTRITLYPSSYKISIASNKFILRGFENDGKSGNLEIHLLSEPEQPEIGADGGKSSKKSKEFIQKNIQSFLAYGIHSHFFGLNNAERMLLKATHPDKMAKKDERIKRKMALFATKKKKFEKLLGRGLGADEVKILIEENQSFFNDIQLYSVSPAYRGLLSCWSSELMKKEDVFDINKYPILIRTPIKKYKHKKQNRLKPDQYEYFLQISSEPILEEIPKFKEKTVLGIDRGLTHILAMSVYEPNERKFLVNLLFRNEITGWKWKQRKMRSSIKNLERRIRAQKNTHIHENQMKKRMKSITNKIDNLLHNLSREIVDIAIHQNSTIVLESLSDMRLHGRRKTARLKKLNYVLSLGDYEKLASYIFYKAKLANVPVYEIRAAGTSQNCAKCLSETGVENSRKNYQRSGKTGQCKIHGQIDADLNASRTIAISYSKGLNDPVRIC